ALVPVLRELPLARSPPVVAQQLAARQHGVGLALHGRFHERHSVAVSLLQQLTRKHEARRYRTRLAREELPPESQGARRPLAKLLLEIGQLERFVHRETGRRALRTQRREARAPALRLLVHPLPGSRDPLAPARVERARAPTAGQYRSRR